MYAATNQIVRRNYVHYLIPLILVSLGGTLQSFVDKIIVSNLLGSYAMTVENYAGPLTQYCKFVTYLVAVGGALIFARYLGNLEREKAEQVYRICMITAVVFGLIVTIPGFFCIDWLAQFLGAEGEYLELLKVYLVPTLVLIPIYILAMSLGSFLSPMGYPKISSIVILAANIINLGLDVVFIKCFHTDVEGAQWATVFGYILAIIGLIIYVKIKKIKMPGFKGKLSFPLLGEALVCGITPALSQLGLIVYYCYFNNLVTDLGGSNAATVFSLCLQLLSIFSILSQGVCGTLRTFVGVYQGFDDTRAIRFVLRVSTAIMLVWGALLILFIQLKSEWFLDLYNIQDERDMAAAAIRVYAWLFLFKGFVLIGRDYYNVMKHKYLSMAITLVEGSVGVIILGTILSKAIGLDGIWMSFPIVTCIMFIFVGIKMAVDGVWFKKKEEKNAEVFTCTLPLETLEMERIKETMYEFGSRLPLDRKITDRLILMIEETYIFMARFTEGTKYLDVIVRRLEDKAIMFLLSGGKAFNPVDIKEEDKFNLAILHDLPDYVKYDYVINMNTIKLEFHLDGKDARAVPNE